MLFLILFVAGALVLPITFDVSRHGRNNIFVRSGHDFVNFPIVQNTLRKFHLATARAEVVVLSLAGTTVSVVLVLYGAWKLLEWIIGSVIRST